MSFAMLGNRRRTILLVDQDPHFRATLRGVLEDAGFMVGEAANGKEGERTAMRIRPDAILAELMLEGVDTGGLVAQRLREVGEKFPIYLISSAAESMHTDFNFHDLGISGIFAKPLDPKAVVQTLRARLKMNS
jgi:two-component system chemotaxis response regulator CheY